jgi:hypothetical protein
MQQAMRSKKMPNKTHRVFWTIIAVFLMLIPEIAAAVCQSDGSIDSNAGETSKAAVDSTSPQKIPAGTAGTGTSKPAGWTWSDLWNGSFTISPWVLAMRTLKPQDQDSNIIRIITATIIAHSTRQTRIARRWRVWTTFSSVSTEIFSAIIMAADIQLITLSRRGGTMEVG